MRGQTEAPDGGAPMLAAGGEAKYRSYRSPTGLPAYERIDNAESRRVSNLAPSPTSRIEQAEASSECRVTSGFGSLNN